MQRPGRSLFLGSRKGNADLVIEGIDRKGRWARLNRNLRHVNSSIQK